MCFVTPTGESSVVYDCIVNPKVIADSQNDPTGNYRNFLCELALQYVEQKVCCLVF
jgi:hypothetical protein